MLTKVTMMTTVWLHFGYSGTKVQVKNQPLGASPKVSSCAFEPPERHDSGTFSGW